jgi:VIT1/CCC1 family predicted Fe2+/Mn2+ transporter
LALIVDRLTDEERRLVDSLMARAASLAPDDRRRVATSIAKTLRSKVPGADGYSDDDEFLRAVAAALGSKAAVDESTAASGAKLSDPDSGVEVQKPKLPMPLRMIGGMAFAGIALVVGALATVAPVVLLSASTGGWFGLGVSLVLCVVFAFVLEVVARVLSAKAPYAFKAVETVWPPLIGLITGYATARVNLDLLNGPHPPTDWTYLDGSRFSMTLILSNANLVFWPLVGAGVCTLASFLFSRSRYFASRARARA